MIQFKLLKKAIHQRQFIREDFFEDMLTTMNNMPANEYMIILLDFNVRIGKDIIPGRKQRFNENTMNENDLFSPNRVI